MAKKIRQNDEIIVLTGKYKGKRGKVIDILNTEKIIVQGINMVKKHQKPIPTINKPGGILEKESAIHISNVAIFNISTGRSDKIGFKFQNGKKVRFFKSTGNII